MSSGKQLRRVAALGVAVACAVSVLAGPAPAAAEAGGGAASRGADGGSAVQPPMTTRVLADGTVVREIEPQALRALTGAARAAGCGRVCDGKNPASWVWKGPGGPSNWYPCGDDAVTVREAYEPGGGPRVVELRYSPRCRTAWARATAFYHLTATSYHNNGNKRTFVEEGRDPRYPDNVSWTAMLDNQNLRAAACAGFWGNGWEEYCTGRYKG